MHLSEQMLHVFASSYNVMRKLSKVSPGCCALQRKLQHFTISFAEKHHTHAPDQGMVVALQQATTVMLRVWVSHAQREDVDNA